MSELDWSTDRRRNDFAGVLRIAEPLGDAFIVKLESEKSS
jgi:hypothetical protein